MGGMIPWLILSHIGDDVIKGNYEIKEKEWKMESHTFGLRKEGRKLPLLTHTVNTPKRRRESQRERRKWGENEREKEREMRRRNDGKMKEEKEKK